VKAPFSRTSPREIAPTFEDIHRSETAAILVRDGRVLIPDRKSRWSPDYSPVNQLPNLRGGRVEPSPRKGEDLSRTHSCNHSDTPKTDQSVRKAALPTGLLKEIELWRESPFPRPTTPGYSRPRIRLALQRELLAPAYGAEAGESRFGVGQLSGNAADARHINERSGDRRKARRRSTRPRA